MPVEIWADGLMLVECEVCHQKYKRISPAHLKKHGMSMEEYRHLFPNGLLNSVVFCNSRVGDGNPFYGMKHTEEHKQMISELTSGINNPMFGKGYKIEGDKNGMRTHPGSNIGTIVFNLEQRRKMSERMRGPRNPNWRGGIDNYNSRTPEQRFLWKNIAKQVRERDGYICQECEKPALCVHHIIPYRVGGPDELWNLILLCSSCHRKIESQEGVIKI